MRLCKQATGKKGNRRASVFWSGLGLLRLRRLVPQNNNNEKRNRTATVYSRTFPIQFPNGFRDTRRMNCILFKLAFGE